MFAIRFEMFYVVHENLFNPSVNKEAKIFRIEIVLATLKKSAVMMFERELEQNSSFLIPVHSALNLHTASLKINCASDPCGNKKSNLSFPNFILCLKLK